MDRRDGQVHAGKALALGLLVLGGWGAVAPYLGRPLGFVVVQRPLVEVVDHVVPGLVAVGVGLLGLARNRLPLPATLAAVLAGLWMAGTHVPLLAQVPGHGVDLASALWHSLPGLLLLGLAAAAAALAWRSEPPA